MRVLLTGASGFVGSYVYPALVAAGHDVRCGTRSPAQARARDDSRTWVGLDVEDGSTVESALASCDAALYLVHGLGQGADYPEREARSAARFVEIASRHGVRRIVYLGGVMPPEGKRSKHLSSRQRTGELLRGGAVSTVELRAAMIVGVGSASWTMVRDLAARLPAMLLPRWLRNHSHPVAIDDVVWALLAALTLPEGAPQVFELPGPERISHRRVLRRVAALLGHNRLMLNVPVLTPRLSSYWIALVTRVSLALARELVEGVRFDLDPSGQSLWQATGHEPMALEQAASLAIADERGGGFPTADARARMAAIGRSFASGRARADVSYGSR